ncbi:MAG: ABC transporter permease, partial [Gammaproteobacteria bacterium]|nr:ABC transporter permease [Gammaproteobacteria bacterium]
AALMVAVSATVGVGIMVDSFRQTVDRWLKYRLQADIYVTAPGVATNRSRGILDPGLVERLATTPGVAHMSSGRHLTLHSSLGQIQTTVLRIAPDSVNGFRFLSRLEGDLWSSFQELDTVLISEPFAFRHNLEPGARIPFITPRGKISFKVVGIYADFASDRGIVVMSRNAYRRHWDDDSISALGVYALEDVDQEALIAEMRDRVDTGQEVLIRSNRNLRETSLEVFDRTFTITIVLRMLASVVAFVGVLSALMALQLERAKEIAVLRATGFTQGQVWRMVTTQTGLMGLLSGLLAIPLGLVMAMVLILVINRRSFGWTLDIHVDPGILIQAPLLALVAAGLAGLYPAWRMARTSPALALHEE